MKVFLRERKQTKSGTTSLYLEIYKGTTKTAEGKTKPIREYEYLNLYLIDKPSNPIDKQQNKENKTKTAKNHPTLGPVDFNRHTPHKVCYGRDKVVRAVVLH